MRSSLWAIGPRAETWLISPLVFADTLWSHFKCWLAIYKRIVPHSANKYSHPTIPSPSPWKQHTNCRLFAWQSMQLLAKQTNKLYINMQSNYICKYAVNKIMNAITLGSYDLPHADCTTFALVQLALLYRLSFSLHNPTYMITSLLLPVKMVARHWDFIHTVVLDLFLARLHL